MGQPARAILEASLFGFCSSPWHRRESSRREKNMPFSKADLSPNDYPSSPRKLCNPRNPDGADPPIWWHRALVVQGTLILESLVLESQRKGLIGRKKRGQ
jgi:hypothetical protein